MAQNVNPLTDEQLSKNRINKLNNHNNNRLNKFSFVFFYFTLDTDKGRALSTELAAE